MDRVVPYKEEFDILFPLISTSDDCSADETGSYGNQTHMNAVREVISKNK